MSAIGSGAGQQVTISLKLTADPGNAAVAKQLADQARGLDDAFKKSMKPPKEPVDQMKAMWASLGKSAQDFASKAQIANLNASQAMIRGMTQTARTAEETAARQATAQQKVAKATYQQEQAIERVRIRQDMQVNRGVMGFARMGGEVRLSVVVSPCWGSLVMNRRNNLPGTSSRFRPGSRLPGVESRSSRASTASYWPCGGTRWLRRPNNTCSARR